MYLNCHSYYSVRYGTISDTELLELAERNEIKYLALTDINSTSAILNFLKEAADFNVWPVVGVDFRNGIDQQYVILARSNKGLENINRFLSEYLHEKKGFPSIAPKLAGTYTIYPYEKALELGNHKFMAHEYIGINTRALNKLPFSTFRDHTDKLVVQQTVSFRHRQDFNAHRLLRCIDLNIVLSKLPISQQGNPRDRMLHKRELLELYAAYPYIRENTKRIMQRCKVNFFFCDERTNQNQAYCFESPEKDYEYLRATTYERLAARYPNAGKDVNERVVRELASIREMGFVFDFVANYIIIEEAKSRGMRHIGRGSGANSVVAYILGITNVDPIKLDLYFERFINPYRLSPPDFDIDFSWRDRDEITAFIFERFRNVALMATYVTFQYRAVVRELGKVFGMPKEEIDRFLSGRFIAPEKDGNLRLIMKYGKLIHGFPNYVSVHACGILITERPIEYFSATFMPPKGFRTVMFDMNIAEDVGIFKFDILAQRGLSKITDCLEIIEYNRPDADVEDIDNVFKFFEDSAINDLLKVGNCIGVFYVESPAMRVLMTKLQTQDYLGLVAASSIIRPGVTNGGMKNEFIRRHRDPERRKDAHPVMLEILDDTYGVMVYQEDVLKVAHNFAGLSLAEADVLRRGMRGKARSKGEIEKIESKFYKNCVAKGYPNKVINEIWSQIKAFAGYAFAKGHSASYAVESYQSLYLKKYFPLEFMVAVLNNGGGFYNIETYVHEITKLGGVVEPPCVNFSDHPNVINGKTIYLGLAMVRDLEDRTMQKLLTERQLYGRFKNLDDFFDRLDIGIEQLVVLIKANAFRFTGKGKPELMWKARLKYNKTRTGPKMPMLFSTPQVNFTIPNLRTPFMVEAYDQLLLLGFPLVSRFEILADPLPTTTLARNLKDYLNRKIHICGSLVTAKGTPTADKRLMHFGTFLDREGDFFDTVHFPIVSEKFPIRSKGVYLINGTVTEELGYYSIIVDSLKHLPLAPDPRGHTPDNSNKRVKLLE